MKVAVRSGARNPFTGKPIKAGGATAARLETLARSDPAGFCDQLVAAGWDAREAESALKLWRGGHKKQRAEEDADVNVDEPWTDREFADIQDKALNRKWEALRAGLSGSWAGRTLDVDAGGGTRKKAKPKDRENLVMFVYTVLESWGWDPIHGTPLPDSWAWVSEGQKWTGCGSDERLLLALLETCGGAGEMGLFGTVLLFADWVKGVAKRMSVTTREKVIGLICKHCRS